jgi:CheY-like chemotaxis protein
MSYNLKTIRVLVIDDNLPMRMLIRSILLDLGFETVDMAGGIQEGLELYTANRPDIIIVDWRMDKSDGIEFTKQVRKSDGGHKSKIPIIIMTGFTNKERVFAARDAGVTEFLMKPFTIKSLASHLMHIIERPRDFVISPNFTGPDRRRRKEETEEKKRKIEAKKSAKYIDLRGGKDAPKRKD